jgi:DNA helicase-2/ATP-dependent DNA helicase PcrA
LHDDDVYRQFASERRAVVVAPAGCGKTELIARAVGFCPSKQLVLTHTHAGVDAIRARLRELNIPSSCYQVETIHSFALRYAAAYPKSSSVKNIKPRTHDDYTDIIKSAHRLIKTPLIRKVLSLSYGGVFVDEYQDCTLDQHNLIIGLADVLPCRIVGDPLQGIFDFGGNQIVDWDQDVYPNFARLPNLPEPWRWKSTNPQLGNWLTHIVRPTLERKEPIPLDQALQAGICEWTQEVSGQYGPATRTRVLMDALNRDETTFVICRPEQESLPHDLASKLHNRYRSIEPITSDDLHMFAASIEKPTGLSRLQEAHDFASKCLTGQQDFDAVLMAIRTNGRVRSKSRVRLHALAQQVVDSPSLAPVADLFDFLAQNGQPTLKRHQLWHEMRKALAEVMSRDIPTLSEAVDFIRNRSAVMGRRLPKRCISRTVLIKGLGCDHAIVVDADSLDTKNLYVALTRASRHLHVLSRERFLWATDARRSCPECHSQLTLKTGKHGPFIGCSVYPNCNYTESIKKASSSP